MRRRRRLGKDAEAPNRPNNVAAPITPESSSLYRKHRPGAFSELVGQPAVVSGLTEAVRTGRVVHAYLFAGPRGTGKTSAARILAKCLNCLNGGPRPDPDGTCEACLAIANGTAFDVVEIDAASNRGIDQIRELRERVKFAPAQLRTKVYIIDEVHMLTAEAFNALLKTLEEPPEYVVFVLATTELHRVPATILSRCQRYEFRRLSPDAIEAQLKLVAKRERIKIDAKAVERIAFLADGAMRDALVLLEQARGFAADGAIDQAALERAFGESHIELIEAIADSVIGMDPGTVLEAVAAAVDRGADPMWMRNELLRWFRLALLARVSPAVLAAEVPKDDAARVTERAAKLNKVVVFRALRNLSDIGRYSSQPRIELEMALLRTVRPADELDLKRLSERLGEIEARLRERAPGAEDLARPSRAPAASGAPSGAEAPARSTSAQRSPAGPNESTESGAAAKPQPKRSSTGGGLTATKLRAQWPMILNEVKSRSPQCFGFLGHAEVADASDDAVTLHFAKKYYAESLSDGSKCLTVLADSIEQISGVRPQISVAVGGPLTVAVAADDGDFLLAETVLGDMI